MSDDRDERDLHRDDEGGSKPDSDAPEHDEGGLGLTREFARIEAEIEREVGGADLSGERVGGDEEHDDGDPVEPREARTDDADSSEAAPSADRGGETGEWDVEGRDAGAAEPAGAGTDRGEAEGQEADLEGGEADPPEPDLEPSAADAGAQDPPTEVGRAPDGVHGDSVPDQPARSEAPPPAPADAPATEHTVVRPRPSTPLPAAAGGYGGGGPGEVQIEAKSPGLWWRFLTGSILIIVSTATAVALSALVFLTNVAADLQPIPGIKDKLEAVEPGEPQTILILGSDKRADTPGDPGRSDTTLLLRLDAENQVLSLFSLPRDLKVSIPGIGEDRLNAAYSAGGPELTLQTVKELLGIPINHVVNVDFQGFADAVDAIDCVYVDVDRDYFNDNSTAFGAAEQYAEIDVNAGYQRLCGLKALQYVRYRHTDTDIVRAARQQDFLREARQKIQPRELLFNGTGNDLIDVFTKYTSSDLNEGDAAEVVNVLKSFINVKDVPIKEIHFQGNLADVSSSGIAYVTATPDQIQTAVKQFLGDEDSQGARGGAGANDKPRSSSGGDEKKGKSQDPTAGANLAAAGDSFARFGRTSARRLKLPVLVPTEIVSGSDYDAGSRQYEIKDDENEKHAAYKLVIALMGPDALTEYYGVEGTSWSDPPILENPSETREIDGRTYDLYYDGDRLRMVAWRDSENNAYWVSNTLLQTLGEADMLGIAASMDEARG